LWRAVLWPPVIGGIDCIAPPTHTTHAVLHPPSGALWLRTFNPSIRPTRVEGGTNVSRYKNWQHLKLWTFVPLRLRNTPPLGRCGPFTPRQGIGGGPKERRSLAFSHCATPPPPAKDNWHEGSNFPRETHVLTIRQRHLAGRGRRAEGRRFGRARFQPSCQSTPGSAGPDHLGVASEWPRGCPPPRHQKRELGGVGLAL
jgi:hypothetical protein